MSLHQEIFGATDGARADEAEPDVGDRRPDRRPGRHVGRRGVPVLALLAVIVVLGGVMRFVGVLRAYDIYTDEFIYRDEGLSVLAGHMPPLEPGGSPFLVHPPGLFLIEAPWLWVFGTPGSPFHQIASLRVLQGFLALGTIVLLYLLVRRLAGRVPGLVAAGLFAADPYVLRQNGRILQETAVLLLALGGYLCVLALIRRRGSPRSWWILVGAGLLLGCSVLTKDLAVAVTVAPLLVMLALGWGAERRDLAAVLGISAVPYAIYAVWVTAAGYGGLLWQFKVSGIERMIGLDVYTGYNVAGAPSVASTLRAQLLDYGVSYALVVVGVLGAVYLLWRPRGDGERFMALTALGGAALVGYGTLFSTIEEHFLYYVAVPGIVTAVVAVTRLVRERPASGGARRVAVLVVAAVLVLVAAVDTAAWVRTRTVPDTGQEQAVAWLDAHVPDGTTVAVVADQTQEALEGTGISAVVVDDPRALAERDVTYLVVLGKLVEQRYSDLTPAELDWVEARSTPVFRVESRSYDTVTILRSTAPAQW